MIGVRAEGSGKEVSNYEWHRHVEGGEEIDDI